MNQQLEGGRHVLGTTAPNGSIIQRLRTKKKKEKVSPHKSTHVKNLAVSSTKTPWRFPSFPLNAAIVRLLYTMGAFSSETEELFFNLPINIVVRIVHSMQETAHLFSIYILDHARRP
jgi:hypothetical protein